VLVGETRSRSKLVGVATQHRVYAALREVLNHLWKQRQVITFNPIYAVDLEPEETPEGRRWSAEQVAQFLAATADDPLHLMFRLILLRGLRLLLRGLRRGEAVGLRWSGGDLDAGYLTVERPNLPVAGQVVESKPKGTAAPWPASAGCGWPPPR
jgi:integrase